MEQFELKLIDITDNSIYAAAIDITVDALFEIMKDNKTFNFFKEYAQGEPSFFNELCTSYLKHKYEEFDRMTEKQKQYVLLFAIGVLFAEFTNNIQALEYEKTQLTDFNDFHRQYAIFMFVKLKQFHKCFTSDIGDISDEKEFIYGKQKENKY